MRAVNHFTLQAFADVGVSETVKIEHEGDFKVNLILMSNVVFSC